MLGLFDTIIAQKQAQQRQEAMRGLLAGAQNTAWQSRIDNAPIGAVGAPSGLLADPNAQPYIKGTGNALQLAGMAPGIGDIAGPLGDLAMFYEYPETRTPGNIGLSALGLLPIIPSTMSLREVGNIFDMPAPYWWRQSERVRMGNTIETLKDPTEPQIKRMIARLKREGRDTALRTLDTPEGLVVWPADTALHSDVEELFGLPSDRDTHGLIAD